MHDKDARNDDEDEKEGRDVEATCLDSFFYTLISHRNERRFRLQRSAVMIFAVFVSPLKASLFAPTCLLAWAVIDTTS